MTVDVTQGDVEMSWEGADIEQRFDFCFSFGWI